MGFFDSDKTRVKLPDIGQNRELETVTPDENNKLKYMHNALMAAGLTPGYGNIADAADALLYAAEGEFGEAAWSGASAIPMIGQMVAGKRLLKVIADQSILNPLKKSKGSVTIQHVTNQLLEYMGKYSTYTKLGAAKYKNADYIVEVTDDVIPNITDKGYHFLDRLRKVAGNKTEYGYNDLMKAISGDKRPARVVKMTSKKTGDIVYQPFYRSTGKGAPDIKSKGKWLPFEGVLPKGQSVGILGRSGENTLKAKDALFRSDFGEGEMPVGWVIKGFKSPKLDKIVSSSIGGKSKEGLEIHQKIGKMLSELN